MGLDVEATQKWQRLFAATATIDDPGATVHLRRTVADPAYDPSGPADGSTVAAEALADPMDSQSSADLAAMINRALERQAPADRSPTMDANDPLSDPLLHQRYALGTALGKGGMGDVCEALQHSCSRTVAIKAIRQDRVADDHARRCFQAEARVTAQLEHPNIVPVYDAGDHYFVMKRINGTTLEERMLACRSRMGTALVDLVQALLPICDAVAYAHSKGVVHRDIKASNIMVGEFGEVLLMDWGLAASVAPTDDGRWIAPRLHDGHPDLYAGTPGCLPPEVAVGRNEHIGRATDIYLLGALLYQMVSGHLPYDGGASLNAVIRAADNAYTPLTHWCPEAPRLLHEAQLAAMRDEPDERCAITDFADRLRRWIVNATNAEDARRSWTACEVHLTQAQACDRQDWAQSYRAFLAAVKALERAEALAPDLAGVDELRRRTLDAFARAALSNGEIHLAQFLAKGIAPPTLFNQQMGD